MNTDYNDIEQLLERYWRCESSLEEESKLRAFFAAGEVPGHLLPYRDLFVYQSEQRRITIGDDFDERVLSQIEAPVVKAGRITFATRLTPLFKAVAMVAVVLSFGSILQQSFFADRDALDYNYDAYTDTCDDPEVAYRQVSSALMMLSEEMNKSKDRHPADSLKLNVDVEPINK
jgi:hypothetical protein